MYEGVTYIGGVFGKPPNWSCNNSNSSVLSTKGNSNMMASNFNCDYIDLGSHIDDEDFFIEDLSEFSNEDIAAPIKHVLDSASLLQQHSDNTSASTMISKDPSTIKSDCTTPYTTSSGSPFLQDHSTSSLEYRSALHIDMKDSSLISLPRQDETGFDWLTSFGEDNLIYGASNFGMDSFLLSNAEPFGDYDGLIMKHGGIEHVIKVKDMKVGANTDDDDQRVGRDDDRWDSENGLKSSDAVVFTPHATGSRSARSKRARSAGWSSSNILCNNWDNNSPTNSLNSTSQIVTNPAQYSSPSFNVCKQEENNEQHGYRTTHHMELNISSSLKPPSSDKPLSDVSKFCSNDQALNGWTKEEDTTTREESVSNYGGLQPRRCTHCLSQKTPQWRAGPEGPKTLCNACGVRFKSGRLFDEYRPAKSPTFLSFKHSNSHKKVMEMRRRKSFQYNHHHHPQQQQHAAHHACAPPLKHADVVNKIKIKRNAATLEPHIHFSDVALISNRNAVESPSSFLY